MEFQSWNNGKVFMWNMFVLYLGLKIVFPQTKLVGPILHIIIMELIETQPHYTA